MKLLPIERHLTTDEFNARMDAMHAQLDDLELSLSHEPSRVDGEDPTHEAETLDGGSQPLDRQELRVALGMDQRDAESAKAAVRRALNRSEGKATDG